MSAHHLLAAAFSSPLLFSVCYFRGLVCGDAVSGECVLPSVCTCGRICGRAWIFSGSLGSTVSLSGFKHLQLISLTTCCWLEARSSPPGLVRFSSECCFLSSSTGLYFVCLWSVEPFFHSLRYMLSLWNWWTLAGMAVRLFSQSFFSSQWSDILLRTALRIYQLFCRHSRSFPAPHLPLKLWELKYSMYIFFNQTSSSTATVFFSTESF